MIYVKLAGAFALLAGSLYMSSQMSALGYRRLRQTEAFLSLLRYIKAQVSCYKTPVLEIYETFENKTLAECGFITKLRKIGMADALTECEGDLYIDKAEFDLLHSFADELGGSFKEEQLNSCDYYIGTLEEIYKEQKEELPQKCKLYKTLFLAAGIMIIIVFI